MLTIIVWFGAAKEQLEKVMSFKAITINQLLDTVFQRPVFQVVNFFTYVLMLVVVVGAIIIGMESLIKYKSIYNNETGRNLYMPTHLTLWEQKDGELIPHNYFKDEYNFKKYWAGENIPEKIQELRFKDRFVNGIDPDSPYVDKPSYPKQEDDRESDSDKEFLKQFQFMSRQFNHLNDYTISDELHSKQKHHY